MTEETQGQGGILPPKIDLRKNGFLRPAAPMSAVPVPAPTPVSPSAPTIVSAPRPAAMQPAPAETSSQTMRITIPETGAADTPAAPQPTAIRPPSPAMAIPQPGLRPMPAAAGPIPIAAPRPPIPIIPMQPQHQADAARVNSDTMRITVPDGKPADAPQPVLRPQIPIPGPRPVFTPPSPMAPAPAPRPSTIAAAPQHEAGGSSDTMRITVPDANVAEKPQPVLRPQIPVPGPRPMMAPPAGAAHLSAPQPTAIRPPSLVKPEPMGSDTMRITIPDGSKPPAPAPIPLTPKPLVAPAVPASEGKTVIASKKETSRIPLEMAAPSKPGISAGRATDGPKTIRIKPATAAGSIKIGGGGSAIRAAAPAASSSSDEKRKTSRISLESAFAEEAAKPGEGPKTIKLKRPTEAATIKVGPKGSEETLGKTARLDVPPDEDTEDGPTPTKRKTVRIKRPGSASEESREPVTIARADTEPAGAAAAAPVEEDETSWVFPALSFVTIIVMLVLIYIIMATGLVPDMGWIGKVVVSR